MSNAKTLEPKTQGAPAKAVAEQVKEQGEELAPGANKALAAAARGRKPVPQDESPARKFVRLATRRMTKALKSIGYVANLGNKRQYQYTDEQKLKILVSLSDAVQIVRQKFSDEQQKADSFTL